MKANMPRNTKYVNTDDVIDKLLKVGFTFKSRFRLYSYFQKFAKTASLQFLARNGSLGWTGRPTG